MPSKNSHIRLTGSDVRSAFAQALKGVPGPFNLVGRGSEERCHFDRRLAAYMRGEDVPHTVISGYGANRYYPKRLVERAAEILNRSMNREALCFHESCAYIVDE